jgi:hypothetical protein
MSRNDDSGKKLGRLLRALAALVGLAGCAVVAQQGLWWFQNGYWTPESFLNLWLWLGLSYSPRSMSGYEWALNLPLGPVLLIIAIGIFWISRRVAVKTTPRV